MVQKQDTEAPLRETREDYTKNLSGRKGNKEGQNDEGLGSEVKKTKMCDT